MSESKYPMPSSSNEALLAIAEQINKAMTAFDTSALMTAAESMRSMTASFADILKDITLPSAMLSDICAAVNTMTPAIRDSWKGQFEQISKEFQTIREINYEIILHAMENAAPHLEEEQRKTCEDEIIPKLKSPHEKSLTRSELLSIFSILLTMITLLLSFRPDPQQQCQIEQNGTIIQQNETAIQQNERLIEIGEDQNELIEKAILEYTTALNEVSELIDGFANNSNNGELAVDPRNDKDGALHHPEPSDHPRKNGHCLNELADTE